MSIRLCVWENALIYIEEPSYTYQKLAQVKIKTESLSVAHSLSISLSLSLFLSLVLSLFRCLLNANNDLWKFECLLPAVRRSAISSFSSLASGIFGKHPMSMWLFVFVEILIVFSFIYYVTHAHIYTAGHGSVPDKIWVGGIISDMYTMNALGCAFEYVFFFCMLPFVST